MIRLAFIGFGTVGQGTIEVLADRAATLQQGLGFEARVVAVSDVQKGSLYQPGGLDLGKLLEAGKSGLLKHYPDEPGLERGMDSLTTIRESNADVVIEVSFTDLKTGEPALSHCRAAFDAGKGVIMTNKGPVALAYQELASTAKTRGLFFGYEGTVMSGTPALRLAREALAGCQLASVRGILNGTTNYILTQMEAGGSYASALAEAQKLGYAEADPSGDVEGHDAAGKLAILANVALGGGLAPHDVDTTGITGLTAADVASAKAAGERWKLIASATLAGGKVSARVRPERLPLSDPLAGVGGVTNAITYETDLLGPVTLIGPGAGRAQTGFAILSDLLEMHRYQGVPKR